MHTDPPDAPHHSPTDELRLVIEHASHLLPAQGPITVFIHHNTLHAFEQQPFEAALERAAGVFGCEPYLTEERFRRELGRGRILMSDVRAVLAEDLGDGGSKSVGPGGTRAELRMAMLQHPLASGSAAELRWFLAETDGLTKVRPEAAAHRSSLMSDTRRWVMRELRGRNGKNPAWVRELFAEFDLAQLESGDDATWEAFSVGALWRVCEDGLRHAPNTAPPPAPLIRHRDLLWRVTGIDTDTWVHELLIRFTAAFLDQGVSHWPLADRSDGFLRSFCNLYSKGYGPPDRWFRGVAAECARLAEMPPLAAAVESLTALGVPEAEWDEYLGATLLALRGWGGMVHQVEMRGDRVAQGIPVGSLHGFIAVRLLLDRFAAQFAARDALDYTGPLADLRSVLRGKLPPPAPRTTTERALPVFQVAQLLGWTPEELSHLSPAEWQVLGAEVDAFPEVARRRIFHRAYERRFREQSLDALALHARRKPSSPVFQVITCLDEREESFRRHLEEIAPDCETFGAAGFFAVAMYFKGATDAHFIPLCPIVLTPGHWVTETPDLSGGKKAPKIQGIRRFVGWVAHVLHIKTRTPAGGAVLTAAFGWLASFPLVLRILFPRLTGWARGMAGRIVDRAPPTTLAIERSPDVKAEQKAGHFGFTLDEMAERAERLLRDIGLIGGFSRLVFVIGHGSNSLNNPHKSAYDCGACGGSPGAPNGRAAARILNDDRVRERLAAKNLHVPATTRFVGGFHNTCDDTVTLFDKEEVPATHRDEFDKAVKAITETCARNAHERCRRFMSAPLTQGPAEARRHVHERSEDLAQTRPELGHATNAICMVGRRERTRGLYLDRRAFLTAYDPTQDDANGTILARTMGAVFPVCGGINLEYFFSHVDSPGYGCGTKLPHNITSLLGVMDGAASDLRTGLPWQMVEIHEPVRLLIVCETTVAIMQKVLDGNALGKQMTENGWVQLVVQSPDSSGLHVFRNGAFESYAPAHGTTLPAAQSSADWYRGWRDHLAFAEIGST